MESINLEVDAAPHPSDGPLPFARSYQLEALEKAMNGNTLVLLETGAGKTLIAVMLMRSYAHLLRKPLPFIAVFLVPKVVLVRQQAEVVRMHTDLKVGMYWGEMNVDYRDAAMWKKEIDKYEEFYHPQLSMKNHGLPRVLGMTASPIKSKVSRSIKMFKEGGCEFFRFQQHFFLTS